MLRSVALERTDVLEESSASIIRVVPGIVRRLLVPVNDVPTWPTHVSLMMEALHSSETSVLTRSTRRHLPGDNICSRYVRSTNCSTSISPPIV
jgi:hypothetical protein